LKALDPSGISLLLVALGILLRLAFFFSRPPLWGDEAMIAVSFVEGPLSWLGGLRFNQTAAIGYLLLSSGVVRVLGDGPLALRLIPLLAGILSLVLFRILGREVLEGSWFVVAVALMAFSAPAIYYSGEVKQYSLDILMATALFLAILPSEISQRRAAWAALATLGGILLSQASVFVLSGGAVWLWFRGTATCRRVGTLWGLIALAGYLLYSRATHPSTPGLMAEFWAEAFLPARPDLGLYWKAFTGLFGHVLGTDLPWIAGLVALWGAVDPTRRRVTSLLLLPLAVVVGASLLHVYPFSPLRDGPRMGRLLLFASPGLVLLATLGLSRLGRIGTILAVILTLQVGVRGFRTAIDPQAVYPRPDITQAIALIRTQPDTVVVPPHIVPPFRYYSDREGLDVALRPAVSVDGDTFQRAWFYTDRVSRMGEEAFLDLYCRNRCMVSRLGAQLLLRVERDAS